MSSVNVSNPKTPLERRLPGHFETMFCGRCSKTGTFCSRVLEKHLVADAGEFQRLSKDPKTTTTESGMLLENGRVPIMSQDWNCDIEHYWCQTCSTIADTSLYWAEKRAQQGPDPKVIRNMILKMEEVTDMVERSRIDFDTACLIEQALDALKEL